MSKRITDLPDYAALKKLAAALWQQENFYHGAAVMVGAGFSRSAASTGNINSKLPLWKDLSETLAKDLGTSSNSEPLRLAEEYCAYFGKQALHDLVKKEVNDAAWVPSELHKTLLGLPWSEVLTTNWDTLLERASVDVHQPVYSVVARQEDLSSARSPRIVKLHGTVNITEDLVFTQEDYRKYPQRHAAFVNFARQVFIENELCLLGFSGDDPNFLQWAGWVRDQLTTHARRIYLVGALGLSAAKRKYLESMNVAPIDLNDLVDDFDDHDAKHFAATRIFLNSLQDLKPKQAWEWSPTQLHRSTITTEEINKESENTGYTATLLERQLPTLKADRESYPSWLVCPIRQRWALQNQIKDPFPTPKILSGMTPDSRAKLLYEIAWRHGVTYEATPSWLAQELLVICDPAKPCVLTKKQQLEIALLLLKNTRWLDDSESKSIEKQTTTILDKEIRYWPESANELTLHKATVARDRFDYQQLEELTEKITEIGPEWRLRKASLLAELGRFDEGEKLIAKAYRELLGQHRNDRNSIYVLSRLAWAHHLLRGVETWNPAATIKALPSNYQESKCNPWDHIDHIQRRITKEFDKQQKQQVIEPSFEPGRYKDKSNTVTLSNELHPLLLLEGLSNSTGMPLRWRSISFLVEPAARLAEMGEVDGSLLYSLAIRAASSDTSDVLKKVFSRTRIACLPRADVDYLLDHCTKAANYWRLKFSNARGKESTYAIERLRIFIEVLARLSVRSTPEQAKRFFRLAVEFGKTPELQHPWLFESLRHMVEYSLKSTPTSEHHELLLDALEFPLQSEIRFQDHAEWPNPVIIPSGNRPQNAVLDRRIDEIIEKITSCTPQSGCALIRLLPLLKSEFLTTEERQKIANKIWGESPNYQDLPETGLLKYLFLKLPAHDSIKVRNTVRRYLFEAPNDSLFSPALLLDVSSAAQTEDTSEFPDEIQAIDYFERLVTWRPALTNNDPLGLSDQAEKQIGELIGTTLSRSIVPALPTEALSEDNFKKLYAFYSAVDSPETIIAFAYFTKKSDAIADEVEKLIRKGLQDQSANRVAHSSYALLKWRELSDSPYTSRLISRLVYLIGSNLMPGLAALIWTANEMYKKEYLTDGDTELLADILPVIFDSSDYKNITPESREAVSVSLIRAACARLARDFLTKLPDANSELIRILTEAKQDALPEVRFADSTDI